jgi:hypothetical protein
MRSGDVSPETRFMAFRGPGHASLPQCFSIAGRLVRARIGPGPEETISPQSSDALCPHGSQPPVALASSHAYYGEVAFAERHHTQNVVV